MHFVLKREQNLKILNHFFNRLEKPHKKSRKRSNFKHFWHLTKKTQASTYFAYPLCRVTK